MAEILEVILVNRKPKGGNLKKSRLRKAKAWKSENLELHHYIKNYTAY